MPRLRAARALLLLHACVACATGVSPELDARDAPPGDVAGSAALAGSSASYGGMHSGTPSGGAPTGGSGSPTNRSGASSTAGSASTAPSGSGGDGGTGSSEQGNAGGAQNGGSSSGDPTDCSKLKVWEGGSISLKIGQGETITFMGKRYKANQAIDYPITECRPDQPADYCKGWFSFVGDC